MAHHHRESGIDITSMVWRYRSVCLVRQLAAIRQKDVTNVGLQISKSGKFKVLFEDGAIGTSTWVIYPRSLLCHDCIGASVPMPLVA